MKTDNIILSKSFAFAVRVVETCRYLVDERKEYVLSKQLLRSGTSIGANAEEAIGGQSQKDFVAKMSIAYKEARETLYWIRLLQATSYSSEEKAQPLLAEADELCRITGSILKTMRQNQHPPNS